jgi:hypothetical protein
MSSTDSRERLSATSRIAWVAVCLAVIAGLCLLRVRIYSDTTLLDVYSAPTGFDGVVVDLATEAIIVYVDEDSFVLRELEQEIRVHGHVDPEDVGRFVHVRGTFHPAQVDQPAWIEPVGVHVHKGRRWKIWVSLLPLTWLAFLFLSSFRLAPGRCALELRERDAHA